MTWLPRALVPASLLAAAALLPAQDFRPPPGKAPDPATLKAIADKTEQLGKEIRALRKKGLAQPLLADLEIYHRAALAIVKHNEFFKPEYANWTLDVLDLGLQRAEQASDRDFAWLKVTGRTAVRGFRCTAPPSTSMRR